MSDKKNNVNKDYANYKFVLDSNLNWVEIGLLYTLLTLPDTKNITVDELSEMTPDSKSTIIKALNNLNKEGYVRRKFIKEKSIYVYEASELKHVEWKPNQKGEVK